jgi:hypothetical protein
VTLRAWLEAEYAKAQAAARDAAAHNRGVREREGAKAASRGSHGHCSAVARMCALGEVMALLDNPNPEGEARWPTT